MIFLKQKNIQKNIKGQLSMQMLIYGGLVTILLTGFLSWTSNVVTSDLKFSSRTLAFSIAQAGVEYYRWHLAHAPEDYQDGTGGPGPYTHNYYDKSNNLVGQFILEIIPPQSGSTIIIVKSTGKVLNDSSVEKIIEAKLGIPSFAKYAAVFNSSGRFGDGTEVFGEIHSNGGVRFDGIAHNLITSAVASYDDPDHIGNDEFGVHTHQNKQSEGGGTNNSARPLEMPPREIEDRSDVFLVGRQFPVPAVDFTGIIQTLADIKSVASSTGFYRGASGNFGYDVVLKTNDTFDFYRVTALVPPPSGCTNYLSQDGWGTWSIQTETLLGNYPIPSNGLIFLEDDVWVRGQINTNRLTIASARFPDNSSTRSSITINNDLLYTNYDGSDVISLIAQKNINIGFVSSNIIRVDGALMAQNGRVGRYYYRSPDNRCATYHTRNTITTYGMISSNQRYGFAYTNGTGYQTRNLVYDTNLLYSPPPSFPLTTDSYEVLSWKELK